MIKALKVFGLTSCMTATLIGCGGAPGWGDDEYDDGNLDSLGTASLNSLQTNFFGPKCGGCHNAQGSASGTGVYLDTANNTHSTMVGVTAGQSANQFRVSPFDPNNSYLITKLKGLSSTGTVMPPAGSPSDAQIALVQAWILDGASLFSSFVVPDSAYEDASGYTPTQSTKIYDAQFNPLSDQLSFDFKLSGPLDPESNTENMVLVYHIKDDTSTLAQSSDVEISHTRDSLKVTYHGSEDFDQLELQVNNPEIISIMDAQGQALDGDNDGQPGGMSVFIYPDNF